MVDCITFIYQFNYTVLNLNSTYIWQQIHTESQAVQLSTECGYSDSHSASHCFSKMLHVFLVYRYSLLMPTMQGLWQTDRHVFLFPPKIDRLLLNLILYSSSTQGQCLWYENTLQALLSPAQFQPRTTAVLKIRFSITEWLIVLISTTGERWVF